MKLFSFVLSSVILFSSIQMASAVIVKDAVVVDNTLLIEVQYGGGCEDHDFELEIDYCLESFPVQCPVKVKDVSRNPDYCEALITETLEFDLQEEGFLTSYFSGARLFISGADNKSVDIKLPFDSEL